MTTVDRLSEPIVAAFEAWVKAQFAAAQGAPEESLDAMVERVRVEGQRHLAAVAEGVTAAAAQYEPAPRCAACERRQHSKGFERRYVVSRLGALRVTVRRWKCPGCGAEGCPRLAAADVRHGLLPAAWRLAVEYGAWHPYRLAEALLAKLGCPVSDNVVRALVLEVGGAAVARRRAEATAAANLAVTIPAERAAERLYVLADGYKVRLRDEARPWREPRVALLFETAATGPDEAGEAPPARWIRAVSSVVQEPGDEAQMASFSQLVWPEVLRGGGAQAQEMVLLADGADALWRRLPHLVPVGVPHEEILDFYHAAEHLTKAAQGCVGNHGAKALADAWRGWLRAGQVDLVIGEIAARLPTAPDPKAVAEVLSYFRTHRARMRYARLRQDGYHIGSGAVESTCKQILNRVRGPGMRWSETGLECILALVCDQIEEGWNRRHQAA